MSFSTYDNIALAKNQGSYRIHVEILAPRTGAADLHWCDINKPKIEASELIDMFTGRLVAEPQVKLTSELVAGRFTYSISDLVLDDEDHLFGTPCTEQNPWKLWSIDSVGCSLTSWYGALCRIRVSERITSATADTYHALGVWKIKDIRRGTQRSHDPRSNQRQIRTARIQLVGLSETLSQVGAREVRRGDTWCANIPLPRLVEELVERGSKGSFSVGSDLPTAVNITGTSVTGNNFSAIGNMPVLRASDQTWNEDRTFVPRYQYPYSNDVYFVGYSTKENCPQIVMWEQDTGVWRQVILTAYEGFEAAFCTSFTPYLYVHIVSNVTAYQGTSATADHNMAHQIIRVALADLTGATLATTACKDMWRMGQCVTRVRPHLRTSPPTNYEWWWGCGGQLPLKTNLPVQFPCVSASPSLDETYTCRWREATDDSNDKTASSTDDMFDNTPDPGTAIEGFDRVINAGYACGWVNGQATAPNEFYVSTYYHAAIHESFKRDTSRSRVYWWAFEGTDWYLHSFDYSTGAMATSQRVRFGTSDGTSEAFFANCVVAFDVYGSGVTHHLWISSEVHEATGGRNSTEAHLWYCATFGIGNIAGGDLSAIHTSGFAAQQITFSDSRRYQPVFTAIRNLGAGPACFGTVCNRAIARGLCYGFWYYVAGDQSGIFADQYGAVTMNRSAMPYELIQAYSTGTWLALDQATGQVLILRPASWYASTGAPTFASYGDTCDDENTWACCNLTYGNSPTGESFVYGVNASGPPADTQTQVKTLGDWNNRKPQLGLNTPAGRITLWQWALSVTDLVRLADFGDASCWDALEMCRTFAGNYAMGFERDVDANNKPVLFFRERPTTTPTLTIVEKNEDPTPIGGSVIPCERLETYLDTSNIVNQITVPVYRGQVAAPECTVIMVGESDSRTACNVVADQSSHASQTIVLRCLQTGVAQSAAYDGTTAPLLFVWSVVKADLSTGLSAAAATTDTSIYVRGLYYDQAGNVRLGDSQIRVGDYVRVGNGNTREIASGGIEPAYGRIRLSGTVGGTAMHKIGTSVAITPQIGSRFANSADGICSVAAAFTVPTDTTIVPLTVDDSSQLAPGMVLSRDTAFVEVVSVVDSVTVRVQGMRLGTGQGQVSTWAVGYPLAGAIWVKVPGRAYAVGGTGVSFAVLPRTTETHKLGQWKAGDIIRIVCAGLSAKKDDATVLASSAPDSIEKWGVKEWRARVECRLMTPLRARLLLDGAPELARPAYVTTATNCPLLPGLEIGQVYYCKSAHLWPSDDTYLGISSYRVAHVVTGIAHELNHSRPASTVTLRSYIIGGAGQDSPDMSLGDGYAKELPGDRQEEET